MQNAPGVRIAAPKQPGPQSGVGQAGYPGGPGQGPGQGPGGDDQDECLSDALETDVIPRLLAASRAADSEPAGGRARPHDIDAFCTLLLSQPISAVAAHVDALVRDGRSLDTIYLGLVAGTARRLGVLWEEDVLSFAETSIGLTRLHQLLRRLSPSFVSDAPRSSDAPTALLAVAPGEAHALGVIMAADFFARAGWQTIVELGASAEAIAERAATAQVDLVGISASSARHLPAVEAVVEAVRGICGDAAPPIMVGGHLFESGEGSALVVGADAVARDAPSAVELAERLIE